jgi:hypothetical protein
MEVGGDSGGLDGGEMVGCGEERVGRWMLLVGMVVGRIEVNGLEVVRVGR